MLREANLNANPVLIHTETMAFPFFPPKMALIM